MHNFNCFSLLKSSLILFAGLLLTACATNSTTSTNTSKEKEYNKVPTSACVGNAYLQKYGCSTRRINQAAKSGDPDAQYALGYMYYYGIGTIRDKETAKMWIDRAAKQGQPLAKKAEELIANGQHLHSLHHHNRPSGSTAYSNTNSHTSRRRSSNRSINEPTPNMETLNNATPNKSLNEVLPNYGKKSSEKEKSNAVIKSLQKKSKNKPENVNPGKVEPITQHDPRLTPNASPSIKKMQAHRVASSPMAKKSYDTRLTKSQSHMAASPITAKMHARRAMTAIEMQMMEVPKKHFTLQLIGSHNLAAMKSFIAKNHLKGKAVFYSAELNHEKWYMLVYGNYPNLEAARMAMQNLPPTLRQLHPWIKSYRIVHEEIRLRRIVT